MVFNLGFAGNTMSSCFFYFFLIIDLNFLILAVITQIFIAAAELAIPTGIQIEETKTEIETHPVTVEAIISKCSAQFTMLQTFLLDVPKLSSLTYKPIQ